MTKIGAFEAKTQFARLLKRVAMGERITITRHGVPVAMLVPPLSPAKEELKTDIKELNEFRKAHPLKGLSIRDLINEGRRF